MTLNESFLDRSVERPMRAEAELAFGPVVGVEAAAKSPTQIGSAPDFDVTGIQTRDPAALEFRPRARGFVERIKSDGKAGCGLGMKHPIGRAFVAERQGFEPWVGLHPQRFSRPPRSTTPAPLRGAVTRVAGT